MHYWRARALDYRNPKLSRKITFRGHWGDPSYTVDVCDHLLEIASLAVKYNMGLSDDFGIGDSWNCGICSARARDTTIKDFPYYHRTEDVIKQVTGIYERLFK